MKILILIEADDRIEHDGLAAGVQRILSSHYGEDCTRIDVEGVDGVRRDSILQDTLGLSPTVTLDTNPALLPLANDEAVQLWELLDKASSDDLMQSHPAAVQMRWVRDRLARIMADRHAKIAASRGK